MCWLFPTNVVNFMSKQGRSLELAEIRLCCLDPLPDSDNADVGSSFLLCYRSTASFTVL